jgi:acetyl esterase
MPQKGIILLVLALGAITLASPSRPRCAADASQDDLKPGKRFVYKQSGGKPQELEVYFPSAWDPSKNKVPGVLLFHGGNWTGGSLVQFRYACQYFASRGLVAATANYRMHSTDEAAKLPAAQSRKRVCITDAKSAIRWMKQNAATLGVDPQRILTGGASAGGHIAVLATTSDALDDPQDHTEFDTKVVGYLLFNPAFSAKDRDDFEVDALQHLKTGFPPAILFFGTSDEWKRGADAVMQQLKALGNTTTELWLAEGQTHGFFLNQPWQNLTFAAADRFLVEHGFLKGETPLAVPAGGEKLIKAP